MLPEADKQAIPGDPLTEKTAAAEHGWSNVTFLSVVRSPSCHPGPLGVSSCV